MCALLLPPGNRALAERLNSGRRTMKTLAARVLVILAGGLILLSALGIARAQLATPQAPTTTTAIFLPAVIDRSAPAATPTPSPTATTTGSVNLLAGNMPLPTGWHTNGPDTYWEGLSLIHISEPTRPY